MQSTQGNDGGFLIGNMSYKKEKERWFRGDNEILASTKLTNADKITFFALKTFSGCDKIYPSVETLAERCNLSEKSIRRGMVKLEKLGYVSIIRSTGRGKSNEYILKGGQNVQVYEYKTLKDGQFVQKRGTFCPKKGDTMTSQIDNELDKEKEYNLKDLKKDIKYIVASKTIKRKIKN